MKVVAIVGERETEVFEIEKPVPKENQVLIRIKACALCTFEQRVFTRVIERELPYVGGHEFAGTIEKIGDGVDPRTMPIGTKVAVRVLNSCGKCYFCRRGHENLCTEAYASSAASAGKLMPNGLGEYIAVDTDKVYLLDKNISYEQAVFAEPFACVLNSIEKANIELGDDVVIIGGGVMGILHVIAAKMSGARVILSEPDKNRAEMAKNYGADFVIDPTRTNVVEFVKNLTSNRGAEVVVNTTAISDMVEQAIEMTAPLGRCVLYSSMHPDKPVFVSPNKIHNSEMIITGSKSPSIRAFDRSTRILSKGLVNLEPLLTESYDYTDAKKAFERSLSPETYRVMIRF